MKFYIETYGCTLNQHDSALMKELLIKKGLVESSEDDADVIIINTCGVKDATEKRIIERLKGIKKPVVVGGCIAAADGQLARRFAPHATLIGTYSTKYICSAVEDALRGGCGEFFNACDKGGLEYTFTPPIAGIAVSEGCTSACTYCFAKLARPKLRSMRLGEVIRRIKAANEAGVKELRLTSQDMGAYGLERGASLKGLLSQIADIGDLGLKIRIGMINPKHLKEQMEIIDIIMENECFYKFFHVPLQSGSDRILKLMGRENTVDEYFGIIKEIRKDRLANIMNDIIVGFPGENEEDFELSVEAVKRVQADTTNVSKFSVRPGTEAARMQLWDKNAAKKRSIIMSKLCDSISLQRNSLWVGRTCGVTLLEKVKSTVGRNEYYKQVAADGRIGETVMCRIVSAGVAYLKGEIIKD
ncbi:MAG: tRNA (N(6)-L-threonylcarbamoyladenosine(37)-C(2))-methylthiotransferase [Candidatus Micrarchaeota archaeon]|nr:tRNA (N(6)-L-threonylcarbamoyladenosine(37)-C(2))-methylthiotransferase [Candidatus Micrarchaeota archaeon]